MTGPWEDFQPAAAPAPEADGPWAAFAPSQQAPQGGPSTPLFDRFLAGTGVGRVLDTFKQGLKDGWGAEPLGLSPESEKYLREAGIFKDVQAGRSGPLRAFNEAFMRPAAVALDTALRAPNALYHGIGDLAIAAGVPRDIVAMPEAFMGDATMLPKAREGAAVTETPRGPERITSAAVQLDGHIYAAANHAEAAELAAKQTGAQVDDLFNRNFDSDGFVTSHGRYVDRKTAAEIAAASDQIAPIGDKSREASRALVLDTQELFAEQLDGAEAPVGEPVASARAAAEEGAATGTPNAPLAAEGPVPEPPHRAQAAPSEPNQTFGGPADPVIDKAGNINLDRIAAGDDVKDVIRQAADEGGGFPTARRGTISLTETEQLADALGMTPESLDTRKIGTAFNAEEITAARKLLVQSATDLRDLAGKAATSGEADDVLAYAQAKARHMAIQEQVAGLTAEGGRALNAFKIMAGEVQDAQSLGRFLKEKTGSSLDDLREEAKAVGGIDTPGGVSRFMNDSRKPTFKDKFLYYWTNGLLSGPFTHTAYAVSNAVFDLWSVPETAVAGAIGRARQLLPGADSERVMMGEAAARLWGFMRGAPEGLVAGYRALKSGVPEMLPGEEGRPNTVVQGPRDPIGGTAGAVIGTPTRVIGGIHSFFRALSYRQELEAQAWRAASKDGDSAASAEFWQKRAAVLDDPSPKVMEKAVNTANYQTFVQELGETGRLAQQLANKTLIGKMVFPFMRTPLDIFKAANERLPTALADGDIRANLRGENGAVARDTQLARLVLGSSLGAAAIDLVAQGLMTGGGPSAPNERDGWLRTHQPYSVRIGEMWYDYHRFAPLGTVMGVAADLHDVGAKADSGEYAEAASMFVKAASKAVLDETFMRGASELIEAVKDPDRYGPRYIRNQAATLLPASVGMGQVASALDPDMRQARSLVDVLKSKIPGERETLFPSRDIWGEPIANSREGEGAIIASKKVNEDPVNLAMDRLGIFPAPIQREIRGAKLDDQQFDDLSRTAGRLAKTTLDGMVNAPYWAGLPDVVQRNVLTKTIEQSRETARTYMMMQDPAILQGVMNARVGKITGVKPVAP